eukprot:gene2510-2865_t
MATLNPLKPLTRAHTLHSLASNPVDENKVPAKTMGVEKKTLKSTTSRGALSEITNNHVVITGKTGAGKSTILIQPQQTNIISRITRSKTDISSLRPANNVTMKAVPKVDQQPMALDDDEDVVPMTDDIQMELDEEQPENIDLYDAHDPQCVGEYVNEIFEYYRKKEIVDKINPNYLREQFNINDKMRAILVDWMMAVHVRFKMLSETFFLSVNIVDRYLAKVVIPINKLQLVGITSMLLAAKYEEIYSPQINDFIVTSDNACTHEEVISMERSILSNLSFHMSTATPLHFLRRFSKAAGSDSRTHSLSKYLTELSMLDYKMLKYVPSMIAAASIYVARRMTMKNGPYWNITLEYYTCYKECDVLPCAYELNDIMKREETTTLKATKRKYLSPKLMEVAAIPPVDF